MAVLQVLFLPSLQPGYDLKSYLISLSENYMSNSVITGLDNEKAGPPGHLQHLVLLHMIAKSFCVVGRWFSHPVQHSRMQALCMVTYTSFLRHLQNCHSSNSTTTTTNNNNGEVHSLRLFFPVRLLKKILQDLLSVGFCSVL